MNLSAGPHPALEQALGTTLLETVDVLVVVLDLQGRIMRFNRACERCTGYDAQEVKGKIIWDCLLLPEDIESVRAVFSDLQKRGQPTQHENYWFGKQGQRCLIAWSNTVLRDDAGQVIYIVGTGLDITERQQQAEILQQQVKFEQLLGELSGHIRQSLDLQEILSTLVEEVRQVLETDRTLIFQLQANGSGSVLVESLSDESWPSSLTMQFHDTCFADTYLEDYRQGKVSGVADIHQSALAPCYIEFLEHFQVQATLVVPILQHENLWGLLIAHHCSTPRPWRPHEVNLLTRLATQLAIAIQQAELYQQAQTELVERQQVEYVLQVARQDLECRVTERTIELLRVNQQLQKELEERKAAEQALQISQDRYAGILEIANDAIISINSAQQITHFNQGAERIFGYCAPDVMGQPLDVLIPLEDIQAHRQHVAQFGQTAAHSRRMAERQEIFGRRQDGSTFPAEASISKLVLADEIIFTVILRDISARKRAEANLERLSHQNELILHSIGEGLCGLDQAAKITFINAAAEQSLGYTAQELIHQPLNMLLPHPLESPTAQETLAILAASLTDGQVHRAREAIFCRKDRACFPVEFVSTPIWEQDSIVGAVITFKDISDRTVVERMKDEFISIVSHELRTPLTSIHGSLRMLASGLLRTQPEKSERLLKIAEDSTDRLVRLINDILDVERIESGKVRMTPQTCCAQILMVEAANAMQGMAANMGVTLQLQTQPIQIWADPDRILQTLTNLLSNAIKFSNPGGTVWLKSNILDTPPKQPGHQPVCLSVQDQGRGISPDKLDLIFERFQQADSSDTRLHGGTGLGLSICRTIVQQHEGKIWVDSQLGTGSTFYFTIP